MAKTNSSAEKTHKTPVKVLAVALPFIAFLVLIMVWSITVDMNNSLNYAQYYRCELTDATAEKQEDGSYIITATIKNDSSYQTIITHDSIYVEYGSGNSLKNCMPSFAETDLLRSLNYPIIPSGQTVEYKIQITPPEGVSSVRLDYRGVSYYRYKATDEKPNSSITLKLD